MFNFPPFGNNQVLWVVIDVLNQGTEFSPAHCMILELLWPRADHCVLHVAKGGSTDFTVN